MTDAEKCSLVYYGEASEAGVQRIKRWFSRVHKLYAFGTRESAWMDGSDQVDSALTRSITFHAAGKRKSSLSELMIATSEGTRLGGLTDRQRLLFAMTLLLHAPSVVPDLPTGDLPLT